MATIVSVEEPDRAGRQPEKSPPPEPSPPRASISARPAIPKRSSSMRRAFNYLIGAQSPHTQEPPHENGVAQQDNSEEASTEDKSNKGKEPIVPKENGTSINTDNVGKLKADLEDAINTVELQEKELEGLRKEADRLKEEYQLKENALAERKKKLEDHMVTEVVGQIQEARRAEREATATELKREYETALVSTVITLEEYC